MTAPVAAAPEMAGGDPVDALDLSDITPDQIEDDVILSAENVLGADHSPTEAKPADPAKPEATEPKAETKPEAVLPEGYKKDAKGRVHGPDGRVVSKEELAKLATPPQQPATDAQPRKFAYRALSKTYEPEGFTENADGSITITAEKAGDLRAALNAKHVLEADTYPFVERIKGENASLKQENESLKTGTTAEIAQAKALTQHYTKLLEEPDEAKALEQFFHLRAEWPARLAKAEAAHWRQVAEQGKPAARDQNTPRTAPEGSHTESTLPPRDAAMATTHDSIETVRLDNKYRDLTPDHWKQFSERTARTPYAYLRPATADEAKQYGVHPGAIVFDSDAFVADVDEFAGSVRSARETAKSAATLAAKNAASTQPSIAAPPVPGGGSQPAKGRREFKTEKDVNDWLNSDELD